MARLKVMVRCSSPYSSAIPRMTLRGRQPRVPNFIAVFGVFQGANCPCVATREAPVQRLLRISTSQLGCGFRPPGWSRATGRTPASGCPCCRCGEGAATGCGELGPRRVRGQGVALGRFGSVLGSGQRCSIRVPSPEWARAKLAYCRVLPAGLADWITATRRNCKFLNHLRLNGNPGAT